MELFFFVDQWGAGGATYIDWSSFKQTSAYGEIKTVAHILNLARAGLEGVNIPNTSVSSSSVRALSKLGTDNKLYIFAVNTGPTSLTVAINPQLSAGSFEDLNGNAVNLDFVSFSDYQAHIFRSRASLTVAPTPTPTPTPISETPTNINDLRLSLKNFTSSIFGYNTLVKNYGGVPAVFPSQGLISYYKMDETSGSIVSDSKGSNPGTATGTTNLTSGQKIGTAARSFNGTGTDYISIPSHNFSSAFTLNWWHYPKSCGNYNQTVSATNGWGAFVFHTDINCAVYVGTDLATRFTPTQLPANTLILNQWQQFTYTFDGLKANFYKNGALIAGPTNQNLSSSWGGVSIGSSQIANVINGYIDEVGIWNRALSASEVSSLYNGGVGITY